MRVLATNANGDSEPSGDATGTPTEEPHLDPAQAGQFMEKEVVELFESSHPWLRESWDYITSQNVLVRFHIAEGGGGYVPLTCQDRDFTADQLELNEALCSVWLVQIGRHDDNLIHTSTHELAHVYTLSSGVTSTHGPLGVAHLYFDDLISPPGLGGRSCRPNELYADALSILVHGEGIVDGTNYWGECDVITDTVSDQALAVVRSAVAGDTPSWFGNTYNGSQGDPELERVWADVKAIRSCEGPVAAVFQLEDSFGGYCDNRNATESAVGSRVTRNPWSDGGCVPEAPRNVSATPNVYLWFTVSWQEPVDDGGSPVQGYKIHSGFGGTWADDCQSDVSGRGYARYYGFTLTSETEVTIDLASSLDIYLYLRSDSSTSGTASHQNDDIVSGNTDSQTVATLAAGTYTIEATTYSEDVTGSFTLIVSTRGS